MEGQIKPNEKQLENLRTDRQVQGICRVSACSWPGFDFRNHSSILDFSADHKVEKTCLELEM
jgi:hypothetical protein